MGNFKRVVLVFVGVGAMNAASGEVTGNVGFLSDYVFRGIPQADSVANGGLDFEQGGFYLGTWAADVMQGLEVDAYGGYNGEVGDFSYGIGFTGYYYTDDFDDTYQEINLSAGYGVVNFEATLGQYDNFDGPSQDYQFFGFTAEHNGFYGTVGSFTDDFEGEYVEFGWGTEVSGFDVGISGVYSDSDLLGGAGGESTLILSVGKTFTIVE